MERSDVDAPNAEAAFLDALHECWAALEQPGDEGAALAQIDSTLTALRGATLAEAGSVLVWDESANTLTFTVAQGAEGCEHLLWQSLPKGAGVARWVADEREIATVNHARSDSRFFPIFDNQLDFETRSIMAAPMLWRGRVIGVTELLNKAAGEPFSKSDERRAALAAGLMGGLLARLTAALEAPPPAPNPADPER